MASGSTRNPTKQQRGKVDSFAASLTKKGIKLLAMDFDKTLIDIHSRGVWDDGVDKLACHVQPCMRDLLEAAVVVAKEIYVQASTTEFLQKQRAAAAAKDDAPGSDQTEGSSGVWPPQFKGKEAHIASVLAEISNDHSVAVKKHEILLMDDDIDNIRTAITFGHLAFQVQQNVDYDSFDSFQTMLLL
ncbi:hypothetical protein EGW08_008993 [Elysia chlorotica]|uniref:FCP1 homology domain-containing protein n=1 Tax=Elysia chlorotica TaxID=188477 RepID=A0A433TNR4_ELYCH|nr:hypothetical protein EGW08_008993 [Elysia chlorotica]